MCSNGLRPDAAVALCKSLRYNSMADYGVAADSEAFAAAAASTPAPGRVWLDSLDCSGSLDLQLSSCITRSGWGGAPANCSDHLQDVMLTCSNAERTPLGSIAITTDGNSVDGGLRVRLAGPDAAAGRGRLEYLYKGEWGSVCDGTFGADEAGAFCRALGFSAGGIMITAGGVAPLPEVLKGGERFHLDTMYCPSAFADVSTCLHSGVGVEACTAANAVALHCYSDGEDSNPAPPPQSGIGADAPPCAFQGKCQLEPALEASGAQARAPPARCQAEFGFSILNSSWVLPSSLRHSRSMLLRENTGNVA